MVVMRSGDSQGTFCKGTNEYRKSVYRKYRVLVLSTVDDDVLTVIINGIFCTRTEFTVDDYNDEVDEMRAPR